MVNRLGIIVQAHIGSTRLPGKILRKLGDKTVLGWVIERLKRIKKTDLIIVSTSILPEDSCVIDECKKYRIKTYRGSNENVLSRFYNTAKYYKLTDICRICSDNPLIDWNIINRQMEIYEAGKYDIVSTGSNIPLGLGGEIFSFKKLEEAYKNAQYCYQKEHVTPYIYENSSNTYKYDICNNYKKYRFTMDTLEDWKLLTKIYGEFYKKKSDFLLNDIISLMEKNPLWIKINENVVQKKVK